MCAYPSIPPPHFLFEKWFIMSILKIYRNGLNSSKNDFYDIWLVISFFQIGCKIERSGWSVLESIQKYSVNFLRFYTSKENKVLWEDLNMVLILYVIFWIIRIIPINPVIVCWRFTLWKWALIYKCRYMYSTHRALIGTVFEPVI